MDTLTETDAKDRQVDMRNTNIWYNNCPFQRKLQMFGPDRDLELNVATGKIREGFEWILDDNVICTEAVDGLRIAVQFTYGKVLESISTRNCIYLNSVFHTNIFEAVSEYAKTSLSNDFEGVMYGIIPGNPALLMKNNTSFSAENWNFLSYDQLRKQYRKDQWHSGPKTVASVEHWLYEDLKSEISTYRRIGDSNYASFRGVYDRRPDGLMFWQDSGMVDEYSGEKLYRTAKVHNRAFAWWWIEECRVDIKDKSTFHMVRKDVFERLRSTKPSMS
jgi:hypothetical protein